MDWKIKRKGCQTLAVLCLCLLFLSGCGRQPDVLRISSLDSMNAAPLYVAQEKGFFKQQGLKLEIIQMSGSSASLPAMLHGDLDIIHSSPNAGLFNSLYSYGNLIIVGDLGRGVNQLLISKRLWDSGKVTSIRDLKGKTLSASRLGSGSYYMLGKILETSNISMEDVKLKYVDEMNAVAALEGGSIDGGIINDPYAQVAVEQGIAVNPFKKQVDEALGGGVQLAAFLTTKEYAERHPLQLRAFLSAFVEGAKFYNRARNGEQPYRSEVINILSKFTGMEPQVIDKVQWPYIEINGKPDTQSLQDAARFYYKVKLSEHEVDVGKYVNLSFLP
ncbi:MAG: ABC transporter substrate-binding protein [Candidatus Woesearchaeota archaeon]